MSEEIATGVMKKPHPKYIKKCPYCEAVLYEEKYAGSTEDIKKHEKIERMAWENWVHNGERIKEEAVMLLLKLKEKAPAPFEMAWNEAEVFYNFFVKKKQEQHDD